MPWCYLCGNEETPMYSVTRTLPEPITGKMNTASYALCTSCIKKTEKEDKPCQKQASR
jgi:hypothetical protein